MEASAEFRIEVKRYRAIMTAGFFLVFVWGYFFENYLNLRVPYYSLISLEILISAILTFVPRFTRYTDLIYVTNCVIALAHQGYLVVINDTQNYLVISSSLALLIAIFPLKKMKQINFIFISAFLFSLSLMVINLGATTVFYFVSTVSFSIVIYVITIERNKLLEKIKEDFKLLEIERQKSIGSAKMAALGEMSSGIAHEINNPLAILQGNISLMRRELQNFPEVNDKFEKKLNSIDSTIQRISKIIKGLKDFSRDSVFDDSNIEEITGIQLLENTLAFCQTRFINHNVQLIYDLNNWNYKFRGQPTQLSQVLLNLLNNSFDAIEGQDIKTIRLDFKKMPGYFEISVSDNGPGIPDSLRDKIMQPFFTTKEVGKGTGLGLSISQGIMKKHGGELICLKKDQGAEFVLKLPLESSIFY